jgi:hypothetical protein
MNFAYQNEIPGTEAMDTFNTASICRLCPKTRAGAAENASKL